MRETVSNIHSKETRDQLMVVCVLLSNSVYVNDDMCASLCVWERVKGNVRYQDAMMHQKSTDKNVIYNPNPDTTQNHFFHLNLKNFR